MDDEKTFGLKCLWFKFLLIIHFIMKKRTLFLLFSIYCVSSSYAQEDEADEKKFAKNVFLPSFEIGYIHNNANILSGGLLMKTSLEYRFTNNNDWFLRFNYDNSNANYNFDFEDFSNVLEGKTRFSDLLLGLGYRLGDKKWRSFLLVQGGTKFYNYPTLEQNGQTLALKDASNQLGLSRVTLGLEYYFDEKSAVSVEVLQSAVWKKQDFWNEKTGSWGILVGFITSLLVNIKPTKFQKLDRLT